MGNEVSAGGRASPASSPRDMLGNPGSAGASPAGSPLPSGSPLGGSTRATLQTRTFSSQAAEQRAQNDPLSPLRATQEYNQRIGGIWDKELESLDHKVSEMATSQWTIIREQLSTLFQEQAVLQQRFRDNRYDARLAEVESRAIFHHEDRDLLRVLREYCENSFLKARMQLEPMWDEKVAVTRRELDVVGKEVAGLRVWPDRLELEIAGLRSELREEREARDVLSRELRELLMREHATLADHLRSEQAARELSERTLEDVLRRSVQEETEARFGAVEQEAAARATALQQEREARDAACASLSGRVDNLARELRADFAREAEARERGAADLRVAVGSETREREVAITSLSARLDTCLFEVRTELSRESEARERRFQTCEEKLSELTSTMAGEKVSREQSDISLTRRIDEHAGKLIASEERLAFLDTFMRESTEKLANELRISVSSLQEHISKEQTGRVEQVSALQERVDRFHAEISKEASSRATADGELRAQITTDRLAHEERFFTLQESMQKEHAARETSIQEVTLRERAAREELSSSLHRAVEDKVSCERASREEADLALRGRHDSAERRLTDCERHIGEQSTAHDSLRATVDADRGLRDGQYTSLSRSLADLERKLQHDLGVETSERKADISGILNQFATLRADIATERAGREDLGRLLDAESRNREALHASLREQLSAIGTQTDEYVREQFSVEQAARLHFQGNVSEQLGSHEASLQNLNDRLMREERERAAMMSDLWEAMDSHTHEFPHQQPLQVKAQRVLVAPGTRVLSPAPRIVASIPQATSPRALAKAGGWQSVPRLSPPISVVVPSGASPPTSVIMDGSFVPLSPSGVVSPPLSVAAPLTLNPLTPSASSRGDLVKPDVFSDAPSEHSLANTPCASPSQSGSMQLSPVQSSPSSPSLPGPGERLAADGAVRPASGRTRTHSPRAPPRNRPKAPADLPVGGGAEKAPLQRVPRRSDIKK